MVRLVNMDGPFQRELDLVLPPLAAFETYKFSLRIIADLAFTSTKEAAYIEHKVSFTLCNTKSLFTFPRILQLSVHCPWLSKIPPVLDLPLTLHAPFNAQYKLHTAYTKKFVNIHIQGTLLFLFFNVYVLPISSAAGLSQVERAFEFQNPSIELPDSIFKNPILSKLEWKNLNKGTNLLVTLDISYPFG